jgi:multidrug resistance efflux pump
MTDRPVSSNRLKLVPLNLPKEVPSSPPVSSNRPKKASSNRRKRASSNRTIHVVVAAVIFVLACGFAFAVFRPLESPTASGDARWLPVQPQLLETRLGLVGRIEPATRLLITAPFEGKILELAVTEGSRVEKGQPLLTIDTRQLEIQIRQAFAEVLKARGNVEKMGDWENSDEVARARRAVSNAETSLSNTKSRLAETQRLFKQGIVARQEVEELEERLNSLESDLEASQGELQAARNKGQGENRQIAEMELANVQANFDTLQALYPQRALHAPFAGTLLLPPSTAESLESSAPPQAGQVVKQGLPLFMLANADRIEAIARVEETDLHQLKEGMPVEVTGEGFAGLVLDGQIASISSQGKNADAFSGGTTYDVTVSIAPLSSEQKKHVRLGMSTRLAVVTYHAEGGFVLPPEAVRHAENGQTFVIHRQSMNDKPKRIAVKTGRAVPQGVEIFGVEPGYVELPAGKQ